MVRRRLLLPLPPILPPLPTRPPSPSPRRPRQRRRQRMGARRPAGLEPALPEDGGGGQLNLHGLLPPEELSDARRLEEVAEDDAVRQEGAEEEDSLPQHARGRVDFLVVFFFGGGYMGCLFVGVFGGGVYVFF